MKKILFILLLPAIAISIALATGWDNPTGTSSVPSPYGYFSTLYGGNILPLTANTGTLGTAANAWNSFTGDTVYATIVTIGTHTLKDTLTDYFRTLKSIRISPTGLGAVVAGVVRSPSTNNNLILYGGSGTYIGPSAGATFIASVSSVAGTAADSGWTVTAKAIIPRFPTGSTITADTMCPGFVKVAKDTCLEVALFTRTCTRDTLAFMTGADSLIAAYIVSPFGTRGAITTPPYIAGVVDGKLVVDRPEADTASYDRYSVVRILQR